MAINRRHLLAAGAGLPFALKAAGASALAHQAAGPKIGDTEDAFSAWFGPGAEMDGFISYPPLSTGRASYYVELDDAQRAKTIVGDFKNLAGGGITFDWNDAGQSQYLPDDAVGDDLFPFVYHKTEGGHYALRSWQSESLAAETGGSGHVAVVDRITFGMMDPMFMFQESMVLTETAEVNTIVPTGENLGPHSTMQDWVAYNNNVSMMSEAGLVLDNPPLPGFWVIMDGMQIWAELDTPLSTQEAAEYIGAMLPPSALVWSVWHGKSPVTEHQIRLHMFRAHDTGQQILSAQFVDGDEETGTVSRFYLTHPRQ